jgi:hypothetical protein
LINERLGLIDEDNSSRAFVFLVEACINCIYKAINHITILERQANVIMEKICYIFSKGLLAFSVAAILTQPILFKTFPHEKTMLNSFLPPYADHFFNWKKFLNILY